MLASTIQFSNNTPTTTDHPTHARHPMMRVTRNNHPTHPTTTTPLTTTRASSTARGYRAGGALLLQDPTVFRSPPLRHQQTPTHCENTTSTQEAGTTPTPTNTQPAGPPPTQSAQANTVNRKG